MTPRQRRVLHRVPRVDSPCSYDKHAKLRDQEILEAQSNRQTSRRLTNKADRSSQTLLLRCPWSLFSSASPAKKRSTKQTRSTMLFQCWSLRPQGDAVMMPCCLMSMHDEYWSGASSSANEACSTARLAGGYVDRLQGMQLGKAMYKYRPPPHIGLLTPSRQATT